MQFSSIDEVRTHIDALDSQLVALIAQRGECVKAAAAFKTDRQAVQAPARVEAVITKVKAHAAQTGLPPVIIETVYRAMIAAFIDYELEQHQKAAGDS